MFEIDRSDEYAPFMDLDCTSSCIDSFETLIRKWEDQCHCPLPKQDLVNIYLFDFIHSEKHTCQNLRSRNNQRRFSDRRIGNFIVSFILAFELGYSGSGYPNLHLLNLIL